MGSRSQRSPRIDSSTVRQNEIRCTQDGAVRLKNIHAGGLQLEQTACLLLRAWRQRCKATWAKDTLQGSGRIASLLTSVGIVGRLIPAGAELGDGEGASWPGIPSWSWAAVDCEIDYASDLLQPDHK